MNTSIYKVFSLFICLGWSILSYAQDCLPEGDATIKGGKVILVFGATTKAVTVKNASSILLGQPVIGQNNTTEKVGDYGFYSQFLLPPLPPEVKASQGELLDRIQVSWTLNPLGSAPNEGFNIYRDGVFIDYVGPKIRNYNDFNVIAGKAYTYNVAGINKFGEGPRGAGLGFQVPNGVVNGYVRTINDRAVPEALVSLMPMQGFSAKFSQLDGAVALKDTTLPAFLPAAGNDWTLTFWIKSESLTFSNANILSMSGTNFKVRAQGLNSIKVTDQTSNLTTSVNSNEWRHVAFSYEGSTGNGRLYVDGELKGTAPFAQVHSPDSLFIGHKSGLNGWAGRMDEFRIYHTLLNELDLDLIMEGTASKSTPFLKRYWKFDEELGQKSFDIISRHQLHLCGALFDADRPPVRTSAMTDEEGYYQIEGVNYGTGTTFIATPEKDFLMHRSLEFKASESDLVKLPNFGLPALSTIEFWIYNTGTSGNQTFFAKKEGGNNFKVFIAANNQLSLEMNSVSHSFGSLPPGFNHIAFTIDSTTDKVTGYINGGPPVIKTIDVPSNWSDTTTLWHVGGNINNNEYFNGLIDEIAIYDTIISAATILVHAQEPRDVIENGLMVYFPYDEGNGNLVFNVGSLQLLSGQIMGAIWSNFAAIQETSPHEFSPRTRQVTLNPSVTSVDRVDFTDRSTIAVSGFVRYKDTDCFQPNIEILVNDASFSPPIYTDSTGKFIVDFDPGFTGKLSPKFEDHTFSPAFWQITNVTSPLSGILFNNTVSRKIEGKVAGGLCELPIISNPGQPQGTICKVKAATSDGCYERIITLDNEAGDFVFDNLPPLEKVIVSVIEHSDPNIKQYFEISGGVELDISLKDTIKNFLYFATPEVIISSGLNPISATCNTIVLDEGSSESIEIKMIEKYLGDTCYIDSAHVRIINGFNEKAKDTTLRMGSVVYNFVVGDPNPSPPYLKTIQIIGTSLTGRESSVTRQGVVKGIRNKENTFTTQPMSILPSLILRDPPGDGSYAFFEEDSTICTSMSFEIEKSNGSGIDVEIDIAPDPKIKDAAGIEWDWENTIGFEYTGYTEFKKVTNNSMEVCVTVNKRISTSEGDLIIGNQGADIIMGHGLNFSFGFADIVDFNEQSCEATSTVSAIASPEGQLTNYIYSTFYIENTLYPGLEALAESATTPAESERYLQIKSDWENIIEYKDSLTNHSTKVSNRISFDAGAQYEYSFTSSNNETDGTTSDTTEIKEGGIPLLTKFVGVGGGVVLKANFNGVSSSSEDTNEEKSVTIGYVLADDDPLDAYSIEIIEDTIFKTPIFKIKAGQSSCPWEEGTANREAPNLQLTTGSPFVQTDVPAYEPAVFQFQLGNLSATNEDWTYTFGAIPANNPHGAIIKLNGQPLNNNGVDFIIPYGTSQLVTLTVEKGPIEYDYDSLLVALYSGCELARNYALSIPGEDDLKFFSPIYIGAHFIRPCSEVDINVPQQNWVLYNSVNTPETMNITVSGYNRNEPDFKLVRVQYRKENGDGAWINIPGISDRYNGKWKDYNDEPDTLGKVFTQFSWNTNGLDDGNYEIRAIAICTGDASDKPGFSQVIKGRIDRKPPALLGVPQPSDGVYHVGDEVSFTFNQHINCNKLIQADIMNANNVGLYDATTDELIDVDITCFENKIVLDPNFQNEFFENKILRAELHNIKDLVGNNMVLEEWEFYVDRNELAWLSDSIFMTKYDDESKTITAKIHNRGGYPVPYTLQNIPSWIHVVPNSGTLVANETEEVTFTVNEDLPIGTYLDSIIMHTETGANPFFMGGDEVLMMETRVICRPPAWVINPDAFDNSQYNFSMNLIVKLNIEGTLSIDEEDIVGAYVNGELRGVARVEYKPGIGYIAFLTAYSNQTSGETIAFQIWDASECELYANILESFPFTDNAIIGTLGTPQILHTSGEILRKIYLHPGWNWISLNLNLPDPSLNNALSSLSSPDGATIKTQGSFSQYSSALQQWIGSLSNVSPLTMYQYKGVNNDSISLVGEQLTPMSIPIAVGWNWIGYLPNVKLPVNVALASITPQNGDIIKSQTEFAVYDATLGWVGSLEFMSPPNGYLLKSTNAASLLYPNINNFTGNGSGTNRKGNTIIDIEDNYERSTQDIDIKKAELRTKPNWEVDPTKYEYTMNAIAVVAKEEVENLLKAGDEVGAFVNDEVRGNTKAIFIPSLNSYMIFLTAYANKEGEIMSFKYYNQQEDRTYAITEQTPFKANSIWGIVDRPETLHIASPLSNNDLSKEANGLKTSPNPFSNLLYINYNAQRGEDAKLTIADAFGKLVDTRMIETKQGLNVFEWKPADSIVPGTYLITLITADNTFTSKVIYMK